MVVRSLHSPSPGTADGSDLTAREREVLALLARGLSNEAIGRELYISATTAKFHVGNVMRKLAVSRRAEAVYAGSKLGLI
jgi:DNA-binding NarL/FixJ family response regulator